LSSLFAKAGLSLNKCESCKHDGDCVSSLIVTSITRFIDGYKIKTGINLLFSLKKLGELRKNIIGLLFNKGSLQFGLCIGVFVLVFRIVVCSMRRFLKKEDEKYIFLTAGTIAGLISILFFDKK
jgi:hypothetical protein